MKYRHCVIIFSSFGVFIYMYICVLFHLCLLMIKTKGGSFKLICKPTVSCETCLYNSTVTTDSEIRTEWSHSVKQTATRKSKHKMALIIPYRNCSEELKEFAPHMLNYLSQKGIPHRMYVIHQVDDFRFNRGALINVGFLEMDSDCDYVAMHDVDHLAIDSQLDYGYPSERPRHLAKSKYARAVGGVLLMTNEHYRKVNGLSNYFWGWGREDDNLFRRIQHARLKVHQPAYTFSSSAYRLIHNEDKRPRDKETHYNQEKMTHRFDIKSGLNSSRYTIESRNITIVNGAAVRFINVRLYCNLTETPSCSKLTS